MVNNRWLRRVNVGLRQIVLLCMKSIMAVAFITLIAFQLMLLNPQTVSDEEQLGEGEWGSESTHVMAHLGHVQLISLANACGLGASSCFKCHNGKRAEAPSTSAWHGDHAKVNNSCVGCHGGNPRLLKEKIAHSGLIAKPVSSPEKSCADCHAGADVTALAGKYHAEVGGGN